MQIKLKQFTEIPTEKLVKADWNYKEDNTALLEKLKENIKRNGQIENIIVRELDTGFFEVVNGNHRYEALKQLGIDKVIAYNLGKISLAHAQRIAIETNETKFAVDQIKLSELIKEIAQEFNPLELVETMPYSSEELDNMIKLTDFDWDQYNTKDGELESDSLDAEIKENSIFLNIKSDEVMEAWTTWCNRIQEKLGYESKEKAFELAVMEALNIPDERLIF